MCRSTHTALHKNSESSRLSLKAQHVCQGRRIEPITTERVITVWFSPTIHLMYENSCWRRFFSVHGLSRSNFANTESSWFTIGNNQLNELCYPSREVEAVNFAAPALRHGEEEENTQIDLRPQLREQSEGQRLLERALERTAVRRNYSDRSQSTAACAVTALGKSRDSSGSSVIKCNLAPRRSRAAASKARVSRSLVDD